MDGGSKTKESDNMMSGSNRSIILERQCQDQDGPGSLLMGFDALLKLRDSVLLAAVLLGLSSKLTLDMLNGLVSRLPSVDGKLK